MGAQSVAALIEQAEAVSQAIKTGLNGHPVTDVTDVTDVTVPMGDEGRTLLDDVEAFVARFIAYPSIYALVAHVLWIAHTHMMQIWDSTPRLAALSPEPASGKTRILEVSELLVPRAVEAVNVS